MAWSRFLFEYLADPALAMRELVRVTRPGGVVVVSDLDGNCVWHDGGSEVFRGELAAAMTTLGPHFDPRAGRGLYGLAHGAGLRDIRVDIRPYHAIAGRIDGAAEDLWGLKLRTASASLVRMGWPDTRAARLVELFLGHLRDPATFTYSVLITVAGRKHGTAG